MWFQTSTLWFISYNPWENHLIRNVLDMNFIDLISSNLHAILGDQAGQKPLLPASHRDVVRLIIPAATPPPRSQLTGRQLNTCSVPTMPGGFSFTVFHIPPQLKRTLSSSIFYMVGSPKISFTKTHYWLPILKSATSYTSCSLCWR